jgi:hypothetical protein
MTLSAEELLAGSSLTYEIEIPAQILYPTADVANGTAKSLDARKVRLRPLNVRDLQLVARAAKENDSLVATLMVQRALVEPEMSVPQISTMHAGLVQYLLEQVNRISGITTSAESLAVATDAPLTKAAFVLAKAFGWTPQQVSELTLGQVLLHLRMLQENSK